MKGGSLCFPNFLLAITELRLKPLAGFASWNSLQRRSSTSDPVEKDHMLNRGLPGCAHIGQVFGGYLDGRLAAATSGNRPAGELGKQVHRRLAQTHLSRVADNPVSGLLAHNRRRVVGDKRPPPLRACERQRGLSRTRVPA